MSTPPLSVTRQHAVATTRWAVQFTGVGGETVVHTRTRCGVHFDDAADAAAHAFSLQAAGRSDAHVVYQTSGTTGWVRDTDQEQVGVTDPGGVAARQIANILRRADIRGLDHADAQRIAVVAVRMARTAATARTQP